MKPKKDAGRVLVTLGSAPWFLELFQELVDSYSQRPMSPHQRDLMSGSLWTNLIKLYTKCPDCVSEFKDKKGRELRNAYEKAFDKSRLLKPNGDIEPKKVHVIPKGKQVQMTMSGKSARTTIVKYKGAVYVAADHERCQNGTHWNERSHKCEPLPPALQKHQERALANTTKADQASAKATGVDGSGNRHAKFVAHDKAQVHHLKAARSNNSFSAKVYDNGFHDLASEHDKIGNRHKEAFQHHNKKVFEHQSDDDYPRSAEEILHGN